MKRTVALIFVSALLIFVLFWIGRASFISHGPTVPLCVIKDFSEPGGHFEINTFENNIRYKTRNNIMGMIPEYVERNVFVSKNKLLEFIKENKAESNPFNFPNEIYKFPYEKLHDLVSVNHFENGRWWFSYHTIFQKNKNERIFATLRESASSLGKRFYVGSKIDITGSKILKPNIYDLKSYKYNNKIVVVSDDGTEMFVFDRVGLPLEKEVFDKPLLVTDSGDFGLIAFDGEKVFHLTVSEVFLKIEGVNDFDPRNSFFIPETNVLYCDQKLFSFDLKSMNLDAVAKFENININAAKMGWLINDEGVFIYDHKTLKMRQLLSGDGWNYRGDCHSDPEGGYPTAYLFERCVDDLKTELRVAVKIDGCYGIIILNDIQKKVDSVCIESNSWWHPYSPPKYKSRIHVSAYTQKKRYDYMMKWPVECYNCQFWR